MYYRPQAPDGATFVKVTAVLFTLQLYSQLLLCVMSLTVWHYWYICAMPKYLHACMSITVQRLCRTC